MKKITFLFALAISINFFAQPIITASDIVPNIGEQFVLNTSAYVNPGPSGTGVTWNFSSLTGTPNNPFVYINPSSTPFAANFPSATLSIGNAGSYSFSSSSTSHWSDIGWGATSSNLYCNYSNPKQMFSFPMNYNSTVNDTYYGSYMGVGANIVNTGNIQVTYDGFGTLILPSGTYTNVVRFKKIDNAVNTTYYGSGSNTYTQDDTSYIWYKPGIHCALLTISNYVTLNSGNTYYSASAYFLNTTPQSVMDNTFDNIVVYPNPASDFLTVDLSKANQIQSIELVDVLGKKIMMYDVNALSIQLELQHLKSGMYFLRFKDEMGALKAIKKIQKN